MQQEILNNLPEIIEIDERIAAKSKAVELARAALSDEVQRKQARTSLENQERELEAERKVRKLAVAKARQSAVADMKTEFDEAARAVLKTTIAAAEAHASLAMLHEQARQANGGRAPFPALHMQALLESTPRSATNYSNWRRQIDAYIKQLPPSRKRVRTRKRLSKKMTTVATKLTGNFQSGGAGT